MKYLNLEYSTAYPMVWTAHDRMYIDVVKNTRHKVKWLGSEPQAWLPLICPIAHV